MRLQDEITGDLQAIAGELDACPRVGVPTHRPVPLLALYTDRRPTDFVAGDAPVALVAANDRVTRNFVLDPNDPGAETAKPPRGRELAANRSWRLVGGC